jgi:transposase-like protein
MPLLVEAARPCRHPADNRWYVDETYVKVGGVWRYVYRAVDQYGQVIDVYVAAKRDTAAARAFSQRATTSAGAAPAEVVTDRAAVYPKLIDELIPAAWHHSEMQHRHLGRLVRGGSHRTRSSGSPSC